MMMYKSVKTGKLANLVERKDDNVILNMEDGSDEQIQIKESTFKRWWKKHTIEEEVEVEAVVEEATEVEADAPYNVEGQGQWEPAQEEAKVEEEVVPVAKKRGPKNENVQLLLNELAEQFGEESIVGPYFTHEGIRKFFHSSGTIALREVDAKRIGIEYTKKNYNHPFKAKINVPNDADALAALIATLLAL